MLIIALFYEGCQRENVTKIQTKSSKMKGDFSIKIGMKIVVRNGSKNNRLEDVIDQ